MLDDVDVDIEGDDCAEEEGSWFSRMGGGVRSLGSGALFLGALVLLFWNEGYSKRHGDALQEVATQVQSAPMGALDAQLDGKPVHLSARVASQTGARDNLFGVDTDGVVIYRHVEMFQWVEYADTTGRGSKKRTRYFYEQEWDSAYHDSSEFHEPQGHENPPPTLTSDAFFAADARFGPYRFDNVDVVRQAFDESWDSGLPGSLGDWPRMVEQLPELPAELATKRWYQLEPGIYYRGSAASENAELGDLSVSFHAYRSDYPLSVIGAQQGERLEPWRASNGDSILLAGGGIQSATDLVKQASAESGGLTHVLRLIGLAGAVLGGAGIAAWMGGFLTMIPLVGRLVETSLMIAGGLFGLMAGLVTIVIGWLAARPWVAALLLIALGSAVTWAINRRRAADGAARRSERAGKLAAQAHQRAAAALQAAMPAAPMALAGAGGPVPAPAGAAPFTATAPRMPTPPPPPDVARFAAADPRLPAPPAAPSSPLPAAPPGTGDTRELPPLEWTPGLIATRPPAVRPSAVAPPAAPRPAERDAQTAAPASSAPDPRRPPPVVAPPGIARLPGFDPVPPREAPQPLFDTVPMRETPAPLFDSMPMREHETPTPADAAATAMAPAPAARIVRVALGSRGAYALGKLVRQHPDGRQETLCFELARDGKPIKRGTQDEVKEALRQALAG